MKGKILVLSLVIAVFSISCSSPSLAYLMDTASSVSTFTAGQVKISVYTTSTDRETNSDADIISASADYQTYSEQNCEGMENEDVCERYTFVKNTGPSDAYMRIRILVPESLLSGTNPLITLNTNTASTEYESSNQSSVPCGENSSELCKEYVYTRKTELASGAMTENPVISSFIYNGISNTSVEGVSGVSSSGTLDTSTSNIKIYTEAIQAQGFTNASDAFAHFTN